MRDLVKTAMSKAGGAMGDKVYASLRSTLERAVSAVGVRLQASERDDVVQAACLRLLEMQRRSEGEREFNTSYLWRVAYTTLVDEIRRRRRRREDPLEPEVLNTTFHAPEDPEREAAAQQLGSAIQGCLEKLVQTRRLAVTLYLQGYGVPESARLVGWQRKKMENLVYRGLADLRRCLDTKGIKP